MEQITLGQISFAIGFIVALVGGVKYIISDMKKVVDKALEPTNKKIDTLEKNLSLQIKNSDMNATKNFLVARLQEMKSGQELDDISKERFFEQYKHYQQLGGNSYIENEVNRMQKEGKL